MTTALDLEVASGNDQTFSHSDLRRTARTMPQFFAGTDFVFSGYSGVPNYDNMFAGSNWDIEDEDDYLALQRDFKVDGGNRPVLEADVVAVRNKAARALQAVYKELGFPPITDEEVELATYANGSKDITPRNIPEDLKAAGAMCAVLRDALEPNLLRTGEGTPVLVHTGPFGNIATGCSSVIADRVAAAGARDGGYILTEAGFGSDMGLERFIDLKCAVSGMHPSVAVVVVTIRALKAHSGRHRLVSGKDLPEEMLQENVDDVRDGAANLLKHLQIVRGFGITPVVAVNVFPTDHDAEIEEVTRIAGDAGARVAVCHPVTRGGEGCLDLAGAVVEACQEAGEPASSRPAYEPQDDLRTKISKLADLYGADGVDYTPAASRLLEAYEQAGFGHLPVIVAKTPLSLSAEPGRKGVPTGWRLPVREVRLAAGAGYVYAICGSLSTMPGLPSRPAAERIDVDLDTGQIVGLR